MTALKTRLAVGHILSFPELDSNFVEIERRTGAGWEDIVQAVIIQYGAPTAPTLQNWDGNFNGYAFPPDVMTECFINFHIDHRYDDVGGTYPGMIYPHVHAAINTSSLGTIRFGVEWKAAKRADAAGAAPYTVAVTNYIEYVIPPEGRRYWHIVAESPDGDGIPQGGVLQVDAMVKCRIFRDAAHPNDTFPDSVFLDTVDVHVPVDVACTPNRQYPFG
jgi:hypothetical protein